MEVSNDAKVVESGGSSQKQKEITSHHRSSNITGAKYVVISFSNFSNDSTIYHHTVITAALNKIYETVHFEL